MFTLCMTCMLASQEHTCPYTQERSPHQHTATLTAAHTRSSCTIPLFIQQRSVGVQHGPALLLCTPCPKSLVLFVKCALSAALLCTCAE